MGFYHIKNIKLDKKNNNISADLADYNLEPRTYYHVDRLFDEDSFSEKYAQFIYNLVSGNFHPSRGSQYSKLVLNHWLDNYYDDVHDIGALATYKKYENVVNAILKNDYTRCVQLPSDRELNPDKYYILQETNIDSKYDYPYYTNQKGELYCIKDGKLQSCISSKKDYGYPIGTVYDIDRFIEYNDFLAKDKDLEL